MKNPVGVGFYPFTKGKHLDGKRLPNTEELSRPVEKTTGTYVPMSFGPIGRNFESRIPLAGTYDQEWKDRVFPFLPADFNPLYYQAAPEDQQIDHPQGGELVELTNLAPREKITCRLPKIELPVEFTDASSERTEVSARLDTILIEPDHQRVLLVWRASAPLTRGILSMQSCVVGRMPRGWYRARELGKDYYRSLADLVAAKRKERA
jgi:hypothetical protein